jgi:RNA polymerase sigma factor (sigma-70 family)
MGVEEARFYAQVYEPARNGSLAALRRTGCSEEEAEDFFATAFEKVMEKVDPIKRGFVAPEMVEYIKRASWRCMIDERRRRVQRVEVELDSVHSLSDPSAVSPAEAAVDREAIAIGREALQTLSERDREIFRLRHQLDLSPQEILEKTPGLSMRTYRKVLERANARVLTAFERIEGGQRCEEMETKLLHRYVADECSLEEISAIEAHLDHCRSCQQAQARLRGHLFDLASGLAVIATVVEAGGRSLDFLGSGWDVVSGGVRFVRDRVRELVVRLFTSTPGASGGDATVGQALFGSPLRALGTCVGGAVAGGACVAALGGPGVGVLLPHAHHHHSRPPAKVSRPFVPTPQSTELIDRLPTATPDSSSTATPRKAARKASVSSATHTEFSTASPTRESESGSLSNSASSAKISPVETGNEFGPGSEQPPTEAPSSSSPAPSGSGSTSSGSSAAKGGQASESSEFGM